MDAEPPITLTAADLPGCAEQAAAALVYLAASGLPETDQDLLARLAQLLNQSGVETYVQGAPPNGQFWAPVLTPALAAAHYRAGRTPVALLPVGARPDVVLGRDWQLPLAFGPDGGGGEASIVSVPPSLASQALAWAQRASWNERSLSADWLVDADANQVLRPEHRHLARLPAVDVANPEPYFDALRHADGVVVYGLRPACLVARVLGVAVLALDVPTAQQVALLRWGTQGLALVDDAPSRAKAQASVRSFPADFAQRTQAGLSRELAALVAKVREVRSARPAATCWPQSTLDILPGVYTQVAQWAARADRAKWRRVEGQYCQWQARCSLREIDGQIYAEHWAAGRIAQTVLVIDHRGRPDDALADTLDSLSQSLIQPLSVHVVSDDAAPEALADTPGLTWSADAADVVRGHQVAWVMVAESGAVLAPHALAEWGLAAAAAAEQTFGIYADEAMPADAGGQGAYPFFKPDCNVALLQSMNYIGAVSLWRCSVWLQHGAPMPGAGVYAMALAVSRSADRACLDHVDGVLFTGPGSVPQSRENDEFLAARRSLELTCPGACLRPLDQWGAWVAHYPPVVGRQASLVVPTGLQVGYLHSLLKGLVHEADAGLGEIILVCEEAHATEVRSTLEGLSLPPCRVVTHTLCPYVHGAALNLGIAQARFDDIVVCDDDVEPLHRNWLSSLLAYLDLPQVGCVAPRLMVSRGDEAQLAGGPVFLGINGVAASYLGEERWVGENGVYGRLQVSQDVSAVLGHCFVFKKSHWQAMNGFDEGALGTLNTVLDFCLRLQAQGRRHIWTPVVGLLHHGGKSMAVVQRDPRQSLEWADRALVERDALQDRWGGVLARDPFYNRHLSLQTPFDIEADIVIDWQTRRHDRPRALAVPLHSGAGQYRVVEPFAALQEAGVAQTSVVLPLARNAHRLLQPIELLRAAPDCLVLQHSVDDGQLALIDRLRAVAPHIPIIQMVDDLFGEVPEKHPNWGFQSREGHQRMMHALLRSQRMVVTTEPLREFYARYIRDVVRVPNALAQQWDGLVREPKPHARLRVGWVGAAQHRGDLEMIADVVAALADEVAWVFMGMCPDAMRVHVHEFHPFVTIADYPAKMASLDLDIAIAPLEDNLFNRCKSNLRLLEYGAMGWPVVCSDVYPYQTDDAPVLRVPPDPSAWVAALRSLYDPDRRRYWGQALARWVDERYRLKNLVQAWQAALFEPIGGHES